LGRYLHPLMPMLPALLPVILEFLLVKIRCPFHFSL
jgi:hypothetical protein